jgi:hypothetical protein
MYYTPKPKRRTSAALSAFGTTGWKERVRHRSISANQTEPAFFHNPSCRKNATKRKFLIHICALICPHFHRSKNYEMTVLLLNGSAVNKPFAVILDRCGHLGANPSKFKRTPDVEKKVRASGTGEDDHRTGCADVPARGGVPSAGARGPEYER